MDTVNQQLAQGQHDWNRFSTRLLLFWCVLIYTTLVLGLLDLASTTPALLRGAALFGVGALVGLHLLLFHAVLINPRCWPLAPRTITWYMVTQMGVVGVLTVWTGGFGGLCIVLAAQIIAVVPIRLWFYPLLVLVALFAYSWGVFDALARGAWASIINFAFDTSLYLGVFIIIELLSRQRNHLNVLVEQVQHARDAAAHMATEHAALATARQRTIAELEATRHDLAAAAHAATVLEERQRMAREIHDTLAQGFTSIVMNLEAAEPGLSPTSAAHQHVEQARQAARDGLAESRQLVWALRPQALADAALPEALHRLAARWSKASGIAASATITGTARPLPLQVDVALLRVAQEALANVQKHAHAQHATLTLSFLNDAVILDVQDDGCGFDSAQAQRAHAHDGGYGLTSMRERVAQFGGVLHIESAPGAGTTVMVDVALLHE